MACWLCEIGVEVLFRIKYTIGMVPREIHTELTRLLDEYPVVTLLGPRQSGKTTLAQSLSDYACCNESTINSSARIIRSMLNEMYVS